MSESVRKLANGRRPAVYNASGRGARHGTRDGSVPGRSVAICRCESAGQLRRDDPERVLEWRSTATGEAHQTGQPAAAVPVVRGGHSRGAARCRLAAILSTQTAAEGARNSSWCGGPQTRHPTVDRVARSDRLRRVLPSRASTDDRAVMPVCGNACVETWSGLFVTGKMTRRPASLLGVRTSHHGPW
jgi:hypothetical protein